MTPHDNTAERAVAKPSVPVMRVVDGRACWKAFGRDEWVHEPELERMWRAARGPGKLIQLSFWEKAA